MRFFSGTRSMKRRISTDRWWWRPILWKMIEDQASDPVKASTRLNPDPTPRYLPKETYQAHNYAP